ncbi:MAG: stage III sporulation protein AF [Candidatus Gastranaerophilales bacterium]|nr:stage III sporulation protein AF [Candidatus Gastranaerophilales bacterium]
MRGLFLRSICQIGIFMVCAQAIVHFRPDKSYEKYMKLLVSVMILVQIFQPIGSLLRGDGGEEFWERMQRFQRQLEQGMEQAQGEAARSEELLEEMTLQQLQERLEEQLEEKELEEGRGEVVAPVERVEIGG